MGKQKLNQEIFHCNHSQKKFKLTFDAGLVGEYSLELCASCHDIQDKKFLIKEEIINEKPNWDKATNSGPISTSCL